MFQVTTLLPEPHDTISKIPTIDRIEQPKPVEQKGEEQKQVDGEQPKQE